MYINISKNKKRNIYKSWEIRFSLSYSMLHAQATLQNDPNTFTKSPKDHTYCNLFLFYMYTHLLPSLYTNPSIPSTKTYTRSTMKYNEISHFSHPHHRLKPGYTEAPFKCDGCKEVGIGSNYKCTSCNYDLHIHCALPTPSISHPFYTKCSFQFLAHPPGPIARYCNACERPVSGFVYHCRSCGFDLHPCCAKLPTMLDDGEVALYLYRKVGSACHRCGRKGRSWSYRSRCKKYNLHVACVKEMLVESWHEICFGRGGVDGNLSGGLYGQNGKMETRIPSLKGTLESYHHNHGSKGRVKKCCEMAALAMQFVISAVLGDPTTLIAGVVGSLMSK